jgi:hypothetical protein
VSTRSISVDPVLKRALFFKIVCRADLLGDGAPSFLPRDQLVIVLQVHEALAIPEVVRLWGKAGCATVNVFDVGVEVRRQRHGRARDLFIRRNGSRIVAARKRTHEGAHEKCMPYFRRTQVNRKLRALFLRELCVPTFGPGKLVS